MEILHALKQWCPYLIGRHFKVKIDHDSLKYLLEQRLSTKRETNMVVDVVLRKDEDVEALLCSISIIKPNWIVEAME